MKVAVAVIFDEQKRVLITQRPLHASHGGCWEFPGGKLEKAETAAAALVREIKEETGIEVIDYQFIEEINYQYPDKDITLIVFFVNQYQGEAICRESQLALRWVNISQLTEYQFPAANRAIIELINQHSLSCI